MAITQLESTLPTQWATVSLPDDWNRRRQGQSGIGWYQMRWMLAGVPREAHAVYIPRVSAIGRVFVNGHYVGGGEFTEQPQRNTGNRAQFHLVPAALLRAGQNLLEIRVQAMANFRCGLSAVQVGLESELRPVHERRYIFQSIGPVVTSSVTAAIGLFMLLLWLQRRREAMYGYLALAALIWAVRNMNLYMTEGIFPPFAWMVFSLSGHHLYFIFFAFFVIRFLGIRWIWLERFLLAYAVCSPLVIALSGWEYMHLATTALGGPLILLTLFMLVLVVRNALQARTTESVLIAFAFVVYTASNIRDWRVLRGELAFDPVFISHYSGLLMFLAVAWILNRRHIEALEESEQLNAALEDRVRVRGEELERSYARVRDVERQAAAMDERQRMVRDMHDGLGAQLVWMLHRMRREAPAPAEIARSLQECLDELRLTIDVLAPQDTDLLTALGTLRHRLGPRLRAAGITLSWNIEDVGSRLNQSTRDVLQIMRIVQEALTNVLKHANATRVVLRVEVPEGDAVLRILIADNGGGFDPSKEYPGHGIGSMRARAHTLGADLVIDASGSGLSITLEVQNQRRANSTSLMRA